MLSPSEFLFLSKYETSHREDIRINSLIVTCQNLLWSLMKHQKMEFTKSSWIWLCKETLEFNINSHLESITNQETVFTLNCNGSEPTLAGTTPSFDSDKDLEQVKYISKNIINQANPSYPSISRDTYEGKFWNYLDRVWFLRNDF